MNEQFMSSQITIGKATDPGIKRKDKPNQDSIGLVLPEPSEGKAPLLILADGMGGYNGGEIASSLAASSAAEYYQKADAAANDTGSLLSGCISNALEAIREKAGEDAELRNMGSTIVLAAPGSSSVHIANVGDSRAYLITASGKIRQLSYDHSFVMEQVREGIITAEEALHHPRRNVLTMSLTGKRESVTPFFAEVPWHRGDHLLICSDGLWGTVPEEQIARVTASLEPQDASERLIALANMNQGPDNISVMIARNGERSFEDPLPDITGFDQSITGNSMPQIKGTNRKAAMRRMIAAGIILLILILSGTGLLLSRSRSALTAQTAVPAAAEPADATATQALSDQ